MQTALDEGALDLDRWRNFQKLQREQADPARKVDPRLPRETRDQWKKIHRAARAHSRFKHGD